MSRRKARSSAGGERRREGGLATPTAEAAGGILLYETEDGRVRIECRFAAAELIAARADHERPNMGLTSWKGGRVTKADVRVGKSGGLPCSADGRVPSRP